MTKRNRSTRYGCPRARRLRPSCHPRSARHPAWFAATCALLTRAHARRPAWFAATCALLTRAHALHPAWFAATCALLTRAHAPHPSWSTAPRALLTRAHARHPSWSPPPHPPPHPPLTPTRSPNSNSVQLLPRESSRFPRRRARCAVVLLLAVRARRVRRRPC